MSSTALPSPLVCLSLTQPNSVSLPKPQFILRSLNKNFYCFAMYMQLGSFLIFYQLIWCWESICLTPAHEIVLWGIDANEIMTQMFHFWAQNSCPMLCYLYSCEQAPAGGNAREIQMKPQTFVSRCIIDVQNFLSPIS